MISIITRKSRKIYPALWISGIISCMLGFIVCMLVFSMLIGGLICGLLWIGIRAFTYVIIFTLIKIIVPKLLGNVKYKKDEMGRTYFSKKKISYFLFVIAVFFTVLLSFLSTIPSNVSGEAKIYLNVGIVIFCLLWYILSIMFDIWYIHLEPTQIIYRNYLGEKKVIKASDIYYFERNSNGSLIIVCSDRKGREWI